MQPLRGIIVPMVTPLLERDKLDVAGLERLIEHILTGGVQGVFILGTTGEAPSLSYRLRSELIQRVCDHVKKRVPVLVGITDTSFVESINISCKAKNAGAQAIVLAPPYYFPAGQSELLEYLDHLTRELPLPLFLYNMPSYTKLVFEPETIRAAAEYPGIVGIKDSSGNMVYFRRLQSLLKDHPDFSLLMGREELLAEAFLLGGHGGVCGGANLIPELYVELYNAACLKDLPKVKALHKKVMEFNTAVSCVGICSDFLAEPFHRFRRAEHEVIERYVKELGIDPKK